MAGLWAFLNWPIDLFVFLIVGSVLFGAIFLTSLLSLFFLDRKIEIKTKGFKKYSQNFSLKTINDISNDYQRFFTNVIEYYKTKKIIKSPIRFYDRIKLKGLFIWK